ncbi:MAG: class I SAM-dependent methyltransferase [Gaiellaceae bacterium]
MLTVHQADADGGFSDIDKLPEKIEGFEDLAFLFSSNVLNYRIAGLRFNEAAYLYQHARALPPDATIAEIGRYQGGSTFLLASALSRGTLYSYDLPTRDGLPGAQLDALLTATLTRFGLEDRVRLVTGDSRTADPPPALCDLIFIDGDHTYDGVRADYERWRRFLRPRGHLVFHDAVSTSDFIPTAVEGVARVVDEIERDDSGYFRREHGDGTLAHFSRTEATAPWG